jgi:hypothetical protein
MVDTDLTQVIKAVATESGADVRTVHRWLAGLPARGATGRAIERAATAHGLTRPGLPRITPSPRSAA